ncbi:MAG: hypothetical protein COT14_00410, partial [Candidatus Diapherotrites archaeon CG08_land_8_20_14_0_20_30_16]
MSFFHDLYYKMENGYYAFLDKLDKAGIHVYRVVDPIDKVVPSFVLILIILGLIVIGLILYFAFLSGLNPAGLPVTVYFLDKSDKAVSGVQVDYAINDGEVLSGKTTALGTISFEAAKGDIVDLTITAGNDEEKKQIVIADDLNYTIKLLFSLAKDSVKFSVNTIDASPLKPVNIDFWCSNPNVTPPESISNTTETNYVIDVDPECGELSVDVKSNDYEEFVDVLTDDYSINLKPLTYGGKGSVVLAVYDFSGQPVNDYSALLSQNGIPINTQSSYGTNIVSFTGLASATYSISVTKATYFTGTIPVTVTDKTESITLKLERDLNGMTGDLLISLLDVSGKAVPGAKVTVYKLKEGNQGDVLESKDSDLNGKVSISVPDLSLKYWVNVTKAGFKTANKKEVNPKEPLLIVMQVPGTERTMKIRVIDADKNPVNNVRIALYDDKDNVFDPLFGITNLDGNAEKQVEEGKYKAYVYKGQFSGFGELFTFDILVEPKDGFDSTVTLGLPKAAWELTLKDKFGMPVPNALIELYDAYNDFPIDVGAKFATPQGLFSVANLRADRKYFCVIKAPSFENYVTLSRFLDPNTTTQETLILEKEKLDKNPKIEFLGLEDSEGKHAIKLAPNNLYKAKFKISLPKGTDYTKVYANFLAGDKDIVEKEMFYIDKVNLSANATLVKGRSYLAGDFDKSIGVPQTLLETRGFENEVLQGMPFEDQTKWVQLGWNLTQIKSDEVSSLTSGQLFVDVYLQIKAGTLDDTSLQFFYNLYAIGTPQKESEKEFTYPLDSKAEKNQSSLFNSKNWQFFSVGEGQQTCDDKFCFELTVLDLDEQLKTSVSGDTPYIATLGKTYKMQFNLMNNNLVPLTHYRLILENPQQNMHLVKGKIYSALNSETNLPVADKNFDDFFKYVFRAEEGDQVLSQNMVLKGDLDFLPLVEGTGSFKITVIEDKTPIYNKEFFVSVVANKDLNVELEPNVIPSYVDTRIKFTVTDAQTGAFLKDAKVMIVDVYKTVLAENITNKFGVSDINLAAQLPNIDLKLKVYKENYKAYEKNLKTNAKFILIEPEELKVSAIVSDGYGLGKLALKNISELPVKISEIYLEGNFDEYVNIQQTNEYLTKTALNKTIDKEHEFSLPVNVSLTTIAEFLKENREYPAELTIRVIPESEFKIVTKPWEYKVPVTLQIMLGKGLDSLDCLGIDVKKSELVSTGGKNDQDSINIVNGCTVNNKPVKLVNLEAKVNWKGNALGSFTFNRNEQVSRLQSAYYVTLNNKMTEHEKDMFVVDFSPVNGRIAGTGSAEILIRGGYFTDSGIQFVEKKVDYSVSVVNMLACISYVFPNNEVDLISVPRDQKGNFTIKNECDTVIDLKLGVLPDQYLDVRPVELSIPGKTEKQVVIDPKASPIGVYLLEVRGKVPKQHFEGVKVGNEALRIFISPLSDDCLVLDNYEFNLMGTEGKATERYTYLINRCYYKDLKAVYKLDVIAGGFGNSTCSSENWSGLMGTMIP